MSKILNATCDSYGKVTAEGSIIPGAVVMTQGKQASSGLAIFEKEKVTYITANTDDLVTVIEKLITTLTKAADALTQAATGLNSAGSGLNSLAPGSGAGCISAATAINSDVSDLNQVKTDLTTLKGALK